MERNVILIPADKRVIAYPEKQRKKRVAAYCRVSTKSEEQLNSYYHQIAYYIKKIMAEKDWGFVDIYADEGASGTKAWQRAEFNRMLDDCRNGMIDLVLVKSVSRFARNTADCLSCIRELRSHNVDVFFENENLHSIDASSEFIISIHAMHAQEQSISMSNNYRWSIRKKMKTGVWLPNGVGYGYKMQDDEIIKDEQVSEIVELIKNLYMDGYSTYNIVNQLKELDIPSPKRNRCWNETTIMEILVNPVYRGHLEAQHTYTTEYFPFERRRNHGELPKYLYYDDHEAYINEKEAKKIDHIMMMRRANNGSPKGTGKSSMRNYLSGKVVCGECGSKMRRIISHKRRIGYSCSLHIQDSSKCSNKPVQEKMIQDAFIRMCVKLKYYKFILEDFYQDLLLMSRSFGTDSELEELKAEYKELNKQIQKTVVLYNDGLYESAFYIDEIEKLRQEKVKILKEQEIVIKENDYFSRMRNTRKIQEWLNYRQDSDGFDEEIFSNIVDHIVISEQRKITFYLINELIITEEMEI